MIDTQLALVTGGAGFIGSHLCERLVREGYRVISLDNYFTGTLDNHVAGVEYRTGHTKDIADLVPETPDLIFHLGEYSRTGPSLFEPELVFDLNIIGTLGVLAFWREKKSKLVYAGSSTKFANDGNEIPGRDRAPYNFSKAVNSELVHNYGRWYELPYSVAYFYNVYGPRERSGQFNGGYGTVVETFRQNKLQSEQAIIYGSGEQVRAFTHVLDTVEALMLIAKKGGPDEYAISAAEEFTLNQLAQLFDLTPEYREATRNSRSAGRENTTKLQALGWQQQHSLETYIKSQG